MTTTTSSTSRTEAQVQSEPQFRTEDHVPDGYLTSVLLFFLIFVVFAFTFVAFSKGRTFREIKKRLSHTLETSKPRTQRLSGNTTLHFVDYESYTILVVESRQGVALEVVDKPRQKSDEHSCNDSNTSAVTKNTISTLERAE